MFKLIRSSIVVKLSTVNDANFFGQKLFHEVTQEYNIIADVLLQIAVIFEGLGLYGIAKMQWHVFEISNPIQL